MPPAAGHVPQRSEPLRIVYAGTPQFAVPALEALAAGPHQVVAVYSQPDRPAGRGRKLTAGPVKQTAERLGIPCEQPLSLRSDEAVAVLTAYAPDLMVVAAYGLLLPLKILAVPRLGCVNIHASLLPRWRGAAPIQRAILAGDKQTGISIMQMEAGLDTGPVYLSKAVDIMPDETAAALHDRLSVLGAAALLEALPDIAGGIRPEPQSSAGVVYAHKLEKREAAIDWRQPAVEIERRVRAFNPWPVAETLWQGNQLRIWEAKAVSRDAAEPAPELTPGAVPGTAIVTNDLRLLVSCGEQLLELRTLQLPGKRPVSAAELLRSQDLHGAQFASVEAAGPALAVTNKARNGLSSNDN